MGDEECPVALSAHFDSLRSERTHRSVQREGEVIVDEWLDDLEYRYEITLSVEDRVFRNPRGGSSVLERTVDRFKESLSIEAGRPQAIAEVALGGEYAAVSPLQGAILRLGEDGRLALWRDGDALRLTAIEPELPGALGSLLKLPPELSSGAELSAPTGFIAQVLEPVQVEGLSLRWRLICPPFGGLRHRGILHGEDFPPRVAIPIHAGAEGLVGSMSFTASGTSDLTQEWWDQLDLATSVYGPHDRYEVEELSVRVVWEYDFKGTLTWGHDRKLRSISISADYAWQVIMSGVSAEFGPHPQGLDLDVTGSWQSSVRGLQA